MNKAGKIKNPKATLDYLYNCAGLYWSEVGKILGIHGTTARRWAKKLGIPSRSIETPVQANSRQAFGYLCGFIVGDGCLQERGYRTSVVTTKLETVNIFKNAVRKAVPNVKINTYSYESTRGFPNGTFKTDLMYRVQFSSKQFYQILKPFKKEDYHWEIPTFLNRKPGKVGFLQGIFDAEGHVNKRGKRKDGTLHPGLIGLTSKHADNLTQIQQLLKELSIFSKIRLRHNRIRADLYIGQEESKRTFSKLIGFKYPYKQKALLDDLADSKKKHMACSACKQCGEIFVLPLKFFKQGRGSYCSMKCFYKSQEKRTVVVCKYCGENFVLPMWKFKKGQKYCSPECYSKSQRGRTLSVKHKEKISEAGKRSWEERRKNQDKITLDLFQQAA